VPHSTVRGTDMKCIRAIEVRVPQEYSIGNLRTYRRNIREDVPGENGSFLD
jgi:hypothetical protein